VFLEARQKKTGGNGNGPQTQRRGRKKRHAETNVNDVTWGGGGGGRVGNLSFFFVKFLVERRRYTPAKCVSFFSRWNEIMIACTYGW